jgi:hypothetical protein
MVTKRDVGQAEQAVATFEVIDPNALKTERRILNAPKRAHERLKAITRHRTRPRNVRFTPKANIG